MPHRVTHVEVGLANTIVVTNDAGNSTISAQTWGVQVHDRNGQSIRLVHAFTVTP